MVLQGTHSACAIGIGKMSTDTFTLTYFDRANAYERSQSRTHTQRRVAVDVVAVQYISYFKYSAGHFFSISFLLLLFNIHTTAAHCFFCCRSRLYYCVTHSLGELKVKRDTNRLQSIARYTHKTK